MCVVSLVGCLHANATLPSLCSSLYLASPTDLSLSKADKSQAWLFPYQRRSSAASTNLFHVWRRAQKHTSTWKETQASSNACISKACFILTHPQTRFVTDMRCLHIYHSSSFCLYFCFSLTDRNMHIFQDVTQEIQTLVWFYRTAETSSRWSFFWLSHRLYGHTQ